MSEAAMKITYWADYACPYCYIGETALKQAIKNLNLEHEITLEMKAFELDPDGPKSYEAPTAERNAKNTDILLRRSVKISRK